MLQALVDLSRKMHTCTGIAAGAVRYVAGMSCAAAARPGCALLRESQLHWADAACAAGFYDKGASCTVRTTREMCTSGGKVNNRGAQRAQGHCLLQLPQKLQASCCC